MACFASGGVRLYRLSPDSLLRLHQHLAALFREVESLLAAIVLVASPYQEVAILQAGIEWEFPLIDHGERGYRRREAAGLEQAAERRLAAAKLQTEATSEDPWIT